MKKLTAVITCLVMFVSLFSGFSMVTARSTKEVHLKIFIPQPRFKDQYTSYFDQFAKKYEKENNVKVTYDLEMPDPNNASQILKTRLASKEDLDIFAIHAVNDVPTYNKAGYLEDLTNQPFVKKLLPSIKPIVTIRPFSVYGPYEEPKRFVPTLMKSLLFNEEMNLVSPDTARDYIYIDDMIDAYLKIDELKNNPGEYFNIGTGVQSTIKETVQLAKKISGKNTKFQWGSMENRNWDTDNWVADISKARQLLKWTPKVSFENGLTSTWNWFKKNYKFY